MYKLAISYDNGEIYTQFGNTDCFRIYDIEDGQIVGVQNVHPEKTSAEDLADFLKDNEASLLVCGSIGPKALAVIESRGIFVFSGASGSCDRAAAALLQNQLKYGSGIASNHPYDRDQKK